MKCPECGSTRILYASSWPRHFIRVLQKSRKRHCRECQTKWIVTRRYSKKNYKFFFGFLGMCLVVSFFLMILMDFDVVRWVKTNVRQHYDKEYGEDSKQKLWEDLGDFYYKRGDAEEDYGAHPADK